jgi:hypothetical protein
MSARLLILVAAFACACGHVPPPSRDVPREWPASRPAAGTPPADEPAASGAPAGPAGSDGTGPSPDGGATPPGKAVIKPEHPKPAVPLS